MNQYSTETLIILHNTPASHWPRPPIRLLLSRCVRVCRGQNPLPQVTGSEKSMNSALKWKDQRLFSIDLYQPHPIHKVFVQSPRKISLNLLA